MYLLGAPTLAGLIAGRRRSLLSALMPRTELWLNSSILIHARREQVYDAWRQVGGLSDLGSVEVELSDYPNPECTLVSVDLKLDAARSPVFRGIMRALAERQLHDELTALRGRVERAETHGDGGLESASLLPSL